MSAALEALDRGAERVLGIVAPLVFEQARTAADVDAVLRLRYACVVERGWAAPSDLLDGRERDEYDDMATFVVARDAGQIVGTLRLIPPEPGRPLPTERDFGIDLGPSARVIEAGRLVTTGGGGRAYLLVAGLLARGWLTARSLGYDRVVSTAEPSLVSMYRELGMRVRVLGPSKEHWGAVRVPVEIAGTEQSLASFSGAASSW
jgi:N-acyl-L-homoserine lactone synthetase